MGDQYVQISPDSTGKKIHVRERTVSANTVEEQYVIPISVRVTSGVYHVSTVAITVLASAQAATVGSFWLINPIGSTTLVALRTCRFISQLGSALAATTSPRINLERVTFTGTASGATVSPAFVDSTYPAPTTIALTASTGLSLSAGSVIKTFFPVAAATAVGYNPPAIELFDPDEIEQVILRAGEGIVVRQADNGTSSDTRRFVFSICFEEFTVP